jgi:hypothetical protein
MKEQVVPFEEIDFSRFSVIKQDITDVVMSLRPDRESKNGLIEPFRTGRVYEINSWDKDAWDDVTKYRLFKDFRINWTIIFNFIPLTRDTSCLQVSSMIKINLNFDSAPFIVHNLDNRFRSNQINKNVYGNNLINIFELKRKDSWSNPGHHLETFHHAFNPFKGYDINDPHWNGFPLATSKNYSVLKDYKKSAINQGCHAKFRKNSKRQITALFDPGPVTDPQLDWRIEVEWPVEEPAKESGYSMGYGKFKREKINSNLI